MKVYVDKISNKLYSSFSFAEGAITLSALVGVITLSVIGVMSLRPRVSENTIDNSISVSDNLVTDFVFQNVFSDSNIEATFNQTDDEFSYILHPKSISSGSQEYDLISVVNNSQILQTIEFATSVKGYAQDAISLYLHSDDESSQIFDKGVSELTYIPFNATKQDHLVLEIVSTEPINFPIEIEITAKYQ